MQTLFTVIQLVLAIMLISSILLQPQGSGLGQAWGGGGETYHTRRGLEKVVFVATIVLASLFVISSITLIVLA